MGLGPANEQAGQNLRAWRLGANMPGLGMRSGGCGCEMQGARGAGGWLYLQRALEVVDLPPSVREELHGGVDGSTPPSRHVGSNHDPCRSMDRQGGFAGGCDSRRSAEILRIKEAAHEQGPRVERDVRGLAGCAWAAPLAKLVKRVAPATNLRGPRHNAIDPGITEMAPAGALEDTWLAWRLAWALAVQFVWSAWIMRVCTWIHARRSKDQRGRVTTGEHTRGARFVWSGI